VNLSAANFRTSGSLSTDDNCRASAYIGRLGLDTTSGRNMMELRGDVAGHRPGTVYDFKRTIEQASWSAVSDSGPWQVRSHKPAGSSDDANDSDEDLDPGQSGHLYVVDAPGPYFDSPAFGHRDARHYVYAATFVEWVIAKVPGGSWQKVSDDFDWHSVSTLVKVGDQWRRDAKRVNVIDAGPRPVLSPDGLPP